MDARSLSLSLSLSLLRIALLFPRQRRAALTAPFFAFIRSARQQVFDLSFSLPPTDSGQPCVDR